MAIACKIIFHISLFCSCFTFREAISKLTFILWLSKAPHKIFRIENCRFLGKQIYLKVMRNSIFEYFLCKNWIYLEELGYELFMRIKITCQGWNTLILLNDLIIIFPFSFQVLEKRLRIQKFMQHKRVEIHKNQMCKW